MTKNEKAAIFFTNMRITINYIPGQFPKSVCFFLLFLFFITLYSCGVNREETPVIPPETSPLSRNYIGFGVITTSFTHILSDPHENTASLGYLRRGSLVKVIRRQILRTPEGFISWVLVAGNQEGGNQSFALSEVQGWLREGVMEIYNNESQARIASESILK